MAAADRPVEILGERLQIDIRGIQVGEEFPARFGRDIAGGHRHGGKAGGVAGLGSVDRVFEKDHRIVVGERHRAATQLHRRGGDRRGIGTVVQPVDFARLRDVPVLAELAGKVTPRGAEREDRRTGQEMDQGLFLDRIDTKAR